MSTLAIECRSRPTTFFPRTIRIENVCELLSYIEENKVVGDKLPISVPSVDYAIPVTGRLK